MERGHDARDLLLGQGEDGFHHDNLIVGPALLQNVGCRYSERRTEVLRLRDGVIRANEARRA